MNYVSRSQVILFAKKLTLKEFYKSLITKPFFRTTAYLRNKGFNRRIQRRYFNERRVTVYKKAFFFVKNRQPITFQQN
jgi:hypothetical protein